MDLRMRWGVQGADLELEGDDLALDEGLGTECLVSLFTDARGERDGDSPPEGQDLRGWWGEERGDPFGSLLWSLAREVVSDETVERARAHAAASLAWLTREGIAQSVVVSGRRLSREGIGLQVDLRRGPSPRWSTLWDATEGLTVTSGGMILDLSAG